MNAAASDKLDLNILSDPANVSAVRTSIEHFCAMVGLDQTAQQEIGLAVNEALANQILTDVHAPGFLRVNVPFTDIPEFYTAFHIKPGDKMYIAPDKRVKIW